MAVETTINGRAIALQTPSDTPLLWALRDELNLLGVKFGCGAGLCGACTVVIDGAQARACQINVKDVAGKKITTIEGLSGPVFEAVVAGWVKAQAPQCGYCQPGFVTAATSVIAAAPNQTREAALSQLSNLCRCGTYDAIREAVGFALEMLRKAPTNLGSAPAPEKAGAGQ